ncbi:MAG: hypothetical protein ABIJ56_11050 [Pseudomonadota bacterium]
MTVLFTGFAMLLAAGCGGGRKSRSVQEPSGVVAGGQEGAAEGGYARRPTDGARKEEGGSSSAVAGASAVSGKLTDQELNTPLQCPVAPNPMNFGPVLWPAGTADTRWAKNETDVAGVQTSKARPVEVCGIPGQITWLMNVSCPDGKNPYPDGKTAHESRTGNVGSGGRCGTIIDLYVVPCPDREYEVYMDMYQCLPGESFN